MNNDIDKDGVLNAAAIFAAWLIVIVACVYPGVETTETVVRIAYAGD
jgi:hypothetical protein